MWVFYWNAQGLAKDDARAKLEELYHLHSPDIICIVEAQGNIWVLWRNSLAKPDVLSSSKQAITLNFSGDFVTAVHASWDPVARRRLWRQLGLGFISIPWLVLGDFNCVLRLDDKKGGRPIKEIYMNEFGSWISDNGLVEADYIGKKYTWSNYRSRIQRIVSKHDRVIVNEAWYDKYTNWRCKALPRVCSDHSPLFGFVFENPRPSRVPFRIQKMWLSHPSFMQLVEDNWRLPLAGAPPFVFTSKLKRLKEALRIWNRTVFGDVQFRLRQDELRLEVENDLLDYDHRNELQFVKVADAKNVVDDVHTELAVMLKLKSRVTWLEDGDQNTRFFHNNIRMRRSQNTISELKISTNSTLFLQDEIKDYIVNHYQAKFNGGEVEIDPRMFEIDHDSISAAESAFMDAIPSLEEVKAAVFDLGADSAPGPDGFKGSFYRHCWNIISGDLFNAIANCWAMRKIPNGINSSFIVLIPKNNKSNAIKDYRPIGLSNFSSKSLQRLWLPDLAFDTVSWDFIFEVFRLYGFSEAWCSWLLIILSSDRISVMVNGCPEGFSASLEDCGKDMLGMYQRASGQFVSYAKSKFYYGGDRGSRAIAIANFMGMERALFPDKYLGIQLKPGIVRHIHVRQVVEKIMDKLAGWKGKLFSFQARIVLIKSVISSYVIHSMAVYKWPCTVIKQVERAIRNFIWSGDAEKRKYFTVLYDDLCCSKREGGLGIQKLLDVNKAMLMKLWVSI
ncbi:uncharacterized protein LOC113279018 [Papaver somniferum]|uniref:uncharacterized protein LOC113279018 n=1 Tax=Papaver somniferum TaxID=3469 RepID=UPI000E6F7BC0|nr:uncharacterized protein LOC113279018 [Papaver somniferum]